MSRLFTRDFYEKTLFFKPTWRLQRGCAPTALSTLRALSLVGRSSFPYLEPLEPVEYLQTIRYCVWGVGCLTPSSEDEPSRRRGE